MNPQRAFLMALWDLYRAVDVWQRSDGEDDAYDEVRKTYVAALAADRDLTEHMFDTTEEA